LTADVVQRRGGDPGANLPARGSLVRRGKTADKLRAFISWRTLSARPVLAFMRALEQQRLVFIDDRFCKTGMRRDCVAPLMVNCPAMGP
jgi:hypothetical protein